jgi:hypothetical protein
MIAGSECRDASCPATLGFHCFWKYTCSVLLRDRKQQSPQIPRHALLCPTLRREKMPCPGTDRLPVSLTVHLRLCSPHRKSWSFHPINGLHFLLTQTSPLRTRRNTFPTQRTASSLLRTYPSVVRPSGQGLKLQTPVFQVPVQASGASSIKS